MSSNATIPRRKVRAQTTTKDKKPDPVKTTLTDPVKTTVTGLVRQFKAAQVKGNEAEAERQNALGLLRRAFKEVGIDGNVLRNIGLDLRDDAGPITRSPDDDLPF